MGIAMNMVMDMDSVMVVMVLVDIIIGKDLLMIFFNTLFIGDQLMLVMDMAMDMVMVMVMDMAAMVIVMDMDMDKDMAMATVMDMVDNLMENDPRKICLNTILTKDLLMQRQVTVMDMAMGWALMDMVMVMVMDMATVMVMLDMVEVMVVIINFACNIFGDMSVLIIVFA